jgi:holdfast attachment protein HfaA
MGVALYLVDAIEVRFMLGYAAPRFFLQTAALVALVSPVLLALPAQAGDYNQSSSYNSGFGSSAGSENSLQDYSMRDSNGNLTIVNGVITGSSYSSQSGVGSSSSSSSSSSKSSGGSATAIGNSLNVQVQGSWNTVIVDSKQINNGNQTATTTLNGDLKL